MSSVGIETGGVPAAAAGGSSGAGGAAVCCQHGDGLLPARIRTHRQVRPDSPVSVLTLISFLKVTVFKFTF